MMWNTIFKIGKIKALKLSYLVLFVVPVLAKLFSEVGEKITLKLNDIEYDLVFDLPFNWYVLYYSMVFISIANIIYFIFCPSIIKEYNSYEEYKTSGRDENYLFARCRDYLSSSFDSEEQFNIEIGKKTFNYKINNTELKDFYSEYKRKLTPYVFWITYDLGNQKFKFWRSACVFFYFLGFSMFIWLIGEKFCYVTKSLLENIF